MSCVFPGFCEVIASPLRAVSILMSDDFPTLDRPMKAYSGRPVVGHFSTRLLLMTNSADLMTIGCCYAYLSDHKDTANDANSPLLLPALHQSSSSPLPTRSAVLDSCGEATSRSRGQPSLWMGRVKQYRSSGEPLLLHSSTYTAPLDDHYWSARRPILVSLLTSIASWRREKGQSPKAMPL